MRQTRKVGNHGFIRVVETWGQGDALIAEAGIIEAARQSTQGSFRGWARDRQLLEFLYSSNPPHATPFEFAGAVIEVKAPIMVFREWHRHRTQGYNEMSARYTALPAECYIPDLDTLIRRAQYALMSKNRQSQGTVSELSPDFETKAQQWLTELGELYKAFQRHYDAGLAIGIPKEVARLGMPVGHYSQMRAVTSLRNWMAFMTLRWDPAAQYEIREYAAALGSLLTDEFPETMRLFTGASPDDKFPELQCRG